MKLARVAITVGAIWGLVACGPADGVTVINIPPQTPPQTIGFDTVANVLPGGVLSGGTRVENGGIINIVGGRAVAISVRVGGTVNIESGGLNGDVLTDGGTVNHRGGRTTQLDVNAGAAVELSGGAVGWTDARRTEGALTVVGSSFLLNGVAIEGLTEVGQTLDMGLAGGALLTGILADGTPFAFTPQNSQFENATFRLQLADNPAAVTPGQIEVTGPSDARFIREGQSMLVSNGGDVYQHFRAGEGSQIIAEGGHIGKDLQLIGAELIVDGGRVEGDLVAVRSDVTVRQGSIQQFSNYYDGTSLRVEGGEGGRVTMHAGSTLEVSGGLLFGVASRPGSNTTITGGEVWDIGLDGTATLAGGVVSRGLSVGAAGGVLHMSGGWFRDRSFVVHPGGEFIVYGDDIRVDGVPLDGLDVPGASLEVPFGSETILTAILSDGTPLILHGAQEKIFGTLRVVAAPVPIASPGTFHVPTDAVPNGLRDGQTLVLEAGGAIPEFWTMSHGSTLIVNGGTLGDDMEMVGATLVANAGNLHWLEMLEGSTATIRGTASMSEVFVYSGATLNVEGGEHGRFFARPGAQVNVSGGRFGGDPEVRGASLNISGGSFDELDNVSFATTTISGGTFDGEVRVISGSKLVATGGTLEWLQTIGDDGRSGPAAYSTSRIDGADVNFLRVHPYGKAEITAGHVFDSNNSGGEIRQLGGTTPDRVYWDEGTVELVGYDFQLDGVPITGLENVGDARQFNYTPGSILSGVLSDGTPFVMAPDDGGETLYPNVHIADGVLTLTRTAEVPLAPLVVVNDSSGPTGAIAGQTVIVNEGGALDYGFTAAHGSQVEINGGTVGDNFEADRSQVVIRGGTVGKALDVFSGATVRVEGGNVGTDLEVHSGGVFQLAGGQVGNSGKALSGGVLEMTGGTLGNFTVESGGSAHIAGGLIDDTLVIQSGGTAHISGGEVADLVEVEGGATLHITGGLLGLEQDAGSVTLMQGGILSNGPSIRSGAKFDLKGGAVGGAFVNSTGGDTTLHGYDFAVNGVPISGLALPGDDVSYSQVNGTYFTGRLADGSPFVFTSFNADYLNTIRLTQVEAPTGLPTDYQVSDTNAPHGVGAGQTLTLLAGGVLPESFSAINGGHVVIVDGRVGSNLEVYKSSVEIHGGQVGYGMQVYEGGSVRATGGTFGYGVTIHAGGTLENPGGQFGDVSLDTGSKLLQAGGHIDSLRVSVNADTRWTGGSLSDISLYTSGSTLGLEGGEFYLNGNPVTGLSNIGDSRQLILPNTAILHGTLANGDPFVLSQQFNLRSLSTVVLNLTKTAVAPPTPPAAIDVTDANAPHLASHGDSVTVHTGGVIDDRFLLSSDAKLTIAGGEVGDRLFVFNSHVTLLDGSIGEEMRFAGGNLSLLGGSVGDDWKVLRNSNVTIRGGDISPWGSFETGVFVDVYGHSFLIDGVPIAGLDRAGDSLAIGLRGGQLLSGILEDGTPWQFRLTNLVGSAQYGIGNRAVLRVHVVPEPATALGVVLAVGGLLGSRRCRMAAVTK